MANLLAGAEAEPVLAGEAGATILRLTLADGRDAFLKYGSASIADDIADEAARLRWLHGRLPCPDVLQFVCEPATAWLLTTALPGRTGDAWLAADRARLPRLIDGIAAFLQRLHRLPIDDCPFEAGASLRMAAAARRMETRAVDTGDFDDDHAGWTAAQLWVKLVALTPRLNERVVTHGDFSLGNVLFDAVGAVTGVIDVGRLGVADPYQDVAILWQNLREFGDEWPERLLRALGVTNVDRQRLDFHRCLDEFF